MVQVLAIRRERRLARAHAPDDGEPEVEERNEHDDDRQQDRDERAEQLRAAELVVVADDAGSRCPVIAMAEVAISSPSMRAPASPMKSFAGLQFSGRNPMHAPMSTAAMNEARLK